MDVVLLIKCVNLSLSILRGEPWRGDSRMLSCADISELITTSQEADLGIVMDSPIEIFVECMAVVKKCIN